MKVFLLTSGCRHRGRIPNSPHVEDLSLLVIILACRTYFTSARCFFKVVTYTSGHIGVLKLLVNFVGIHFDIPGERLSKNERWFGQDKCYSNLENWKDIAHNWDTTRHYWSMEKKPRQLSCCSYSIPYNDLPYLNHLNLKPQIRILSLLPLSNRNQR